MIPNPADILAALPPDADVACVRDGQDVVIAAAPDRFLLEREGDRALEALEQAPGGWWAGFISYDLGRAIEDFPARVDADLNIPDLALARFTDRIVLRPASQPRLEGRGPGRSLLEKAFRSPRPPGELSPLTRWRSSLTRPAFQDAVTEILEHLRAGDCYQVNLTRRLTTTDRCEPIALFAALSTGNPAPHAAFIRLGGVTVVSASPESFLRSDGSTIRTRPIKGTGTDPGSLKDSVKDRAENVMIVDLARNDLGRVCRYGSVHVPELFAVESHPGLHHLVSTVAGTLRPEATTSGILRACFPAASITGCPKPEVLGIIESLEPVRRGVYCGSVGWLDPQTRRMDLNVAIRTFTFVDDLITFGVGGGIVADSHPAAEWQETELKAARLLALAAGQTSR